MSNDSPIPDLSIVIPMHDEADNVRPLHQRLAAVLDNLNKSAEVIYIDDGSQDATFDRLKGVFDSDDRVRVLKLRANYGLTAALRTGIDAARGSVIVTLDGDLQNDPADIPKLLDKLDEGYDLVCGWRKRREDSFWAKRLPSILGNSLIAAMTGRVVHDLGCTLKAMRSSIAKRLPLSRGFHRFIPVLAKIHNARIAEVVVSHSPRVAGSSKFGWGRTGRVLWDLLWIVAYQPSRRRNHFSSPLVAMTGLIVATSLWLVSFSLLRHENDWMEGRAVAVFALAATLGTIYSVIACVMRGIGKLVPTWSPPPPFVECRKTPVRMTPGT